MPDKDGKPDYGRFVSRFAASDAVCAAMAERRDDSGWILVNTNGFTDFPPEVEAWASHVGPHTLYPMCVLASHAAGKPIPERPTDDD